MVPSRANDSLQQRKKTKQKAPDILFRAEFRCFTTVFLL